MRTLLPLLLALLLAACGAAPSDEPTVSPSADTAASRAALCRTTGALGSARSLWFTALRGEDAEPEAAAETIEGLVPSVENVGTQLRAALTSLDAATLVEPGSELLDAVGIYTEAMGDAVIALRRRGADPELIGATLDAAVELVETALAALDCP